MAKKKAAPPRKCFVIMPMSRAAGMSPDQWNAVFDDLIKPAVEGAGLGLVCERSRARRGSFVAEIVQNLKQSYVVVADLTGQRPNVFYELGARHALSNRTILIARHIRYVPSDLREHYCITYHFPGADAKRKFIEDIKEALDDIERQPDKPDSPIAQYLQQRDAAVRDFTKEENLRKLTALGAEVWTLRDFIDDELEKFDADHDFVRIRARQVSKPAVEALIAEYYVDVPELHAQALRVNQAIEVTNSLRRMESPQQQRVLDHIAVLSGRLGAFLANVQRARAAYAAGQDLQELQLVPLDADAEELAKVFQEQGFQVEMVERPSPRALRGEQTASRRSARPKPRA